MKIWKYSSSAALLINCCWNALDHGLSLNNIAPNMIWRLVHQFILKDVFLCHCQMLNITFRDFDDSSSDFFFAPSWSGYYLLSFLGSIVLPPGGQPFKEFWEELMSFHVKDSANSMSVLLCLTIFLVLESNLTFQRSCLFKSKLLKWNQRDVCFWNFFLLKFKLLWSKTQHTIQCSPLIVLYLENRNDPL